MRRQIVSIMNRIIVCFSFYIFTNVHYHFSHGIVMNTCRQKDTTSHFLGLIKGYFFYQAYQVDFIQLFILLTQIVSFGKFIYVLKDSLTL